MDFNFFKKKEKGLSLIFGIDDDKITASFVCNNKNKPDAAKIGTIIYALNSGMLFDTIINSLVELKTKNNDKEFVQLILDQISTYYFINNKNELVISPLETFNKNAK